MFAQPVDPERDGCPDYYDVVTQPMDLGTVHQKIEENAYKSVAEWKSDVNLIWANSLLYNPNSSLVALITNDLNDMFQRLTAAFSDSPNDDWAAQLEVLGNDMTKIMKEMPKVTVKRRLGLEKKRTISKSRKSKRDSLTELSSDIRLIKDKSKLAMIPELIRDHEPGIQDSGDEIEVDLSSLRPSTVKLLREKVNVWLDED
jgi:hypothetical protein